jgi:hypothetical protein
LVSELIALSHYFHLLVITLRRTDRRFLIRCILVSMQYIDNLTLNCYFVNSGSFRFSYDLTNGYKAFKKQIIADEEAKYSAADVKEQG